MSSLGQGEKADRLQIADILNMEPKMLLDCFLEHCYLCDVKRNVGVQCLVVTRWLRSETGMPR